MTKRKVTVSLLEVYFSVEYVADNDGNLLDKEGSPGVVAVLALIAAGLSAVIYEIRGTWPAEYGGWAVVFLLFIGVALVIQNWQQ